MSFHSEKKLNPAFSNPIGWWEVTTEGDCEGKSTKHLGKHYGHVADIALALADKCFYSLCFRKQKKETPLDLTIPAGNSVNIKFDIDSGTWDMDNKTRKATIEKILLSQPSNIKVEVDEGSYFASVLLVNADLQAIQNRKRAQALAKLSDEEKKLLGLNS